MSYGKIEFSEDELLTLRAAINHARAEVFEKFKNTSGQEKEFYSASVDKFDAISVKLEKPFEDDKSQDEPEE